MEKYFTQITQYVKDMLAENSTVSAMRVMAFIALFAAIGIAFTGLEQNKNLSDVAILCGTFVGAAFGGKMVQKFAEIKSQNKDQ